MIKISLNYTNELDGNKHQAIHQKLNYHTNGGPKMGAIRKIAKKAFKKILPTPGVVEPVAPPPAAPAPAPAPVAVSAPAPKPAPAPATKPAAPAAMAKAEPTEKEKTVALKKKGFKGLAKTGPKGILGDPILYKPTLLG